MIVERFSCDTRGVGVRVGAGRNRLRVPCSIPTPHRRMCVMVIVIMQY